MPAHGRGRQPDKALGVSLRTPAGLLESVRVLHPEEQPLPRLPRIALSLLAANAEPSHAVARLASILRETLAETLRPFRVPA